MWFGSYDHCQIRPDPLLTGKVNYLLGHRFLALFSLSRQQRTVPLSSKPLT